MFNGKKKAACAAMLSMAMVAPLAAFAENETRVITCGTLNLRAEESASSKILGKYGWGSEVLVKGVNGDWASVDVGGQSGYMYAKYLGREGATNSTAYVKTNNRGLNLRAVGENPATADAAGINVTRYKYLATCIGGMIAGLGGLFYIMDYSNGIWSNNGFGDRGWLAIAIVIFATWKPTMAILGSYLFGALYILFNYLNVPMRLLPLIQMLPYLVTIIVLVAVSIRKKRENQPPASLGLSYFREER